MRHIVSFDDLPGEIDVFESEALDYIFGYGKPLEQSLLCMSKPHSVIWLDHSLGEWPKSLIVRLQIHESGVRRWRTHEHNRTD